MTSSHQVPVPREWFSRLAGVLDRRSAPGLVWLFLGAVLAPRPADGHRLDPRRIFRGRHTCLWLSPGLSMTCVTQDVEWPR
jgi:hypothetical protein